MNCFDKVSKRLFKLAHELEFWGRDDHNKCNCWIQRQRRRIRRAVREDEGKVPTSYFQLEVRYGWARQPQIQSMNDDIGRNRGMLRARFTSLSIDCRVVLAVASLIRLLFVQWTTAHILLVRHRLDSSENKGDRSWIVPLCHRLLNRRQPTIVIPLSTS